MGMLMPALVMATRRGTFGEKRSRWRMTGEFGRRKNGINPFCAMYRTVPIGSQLDEGYRADASGPGLAQQGDITAHD